MDVHRALSRAFANFYRKKETRFYRLPSLRWHYPDQVNGFVLSRALLKERQHPMAWNF
jgi:hypothetical protein